MLFIGAFYQVKKKEAFGKHPPVFRQRKDGCVLELLSTVEYNHTDSLEEFEMNKGELVDKIAEKANVTKKEADAILTAALDVITETVATGEKVTLVGFGTFESRDRQAREGRNPSTGKPIQIPATRVPAFSAGKQFKDKVVNLH